MATSPKKKGGRLPKDDANLRRALALAALLSKDEEKLEQLTMGELEKAADVNPKTARSIAQELHKRLALGTVITREGIRLGASHTYYAKSLRRNRELKLPIARQLEDLIEPGSTVAASPGTTVKIGIDHLMSRDYHLEVTTNSLGVAEAFLLHADGALVIAGEDYEREIHACLGRRAVEVFRRVRCQTALLGVSGISPEGALCVRRNDEREIIPAIIDCAFEQVVIATDVTKLTQQDTHCIATAKELVTAEEVKGAGHRRRKFIVVTNHPRRLDEERDRKIAEAVIKRLETDGFKIVFADEPRVQDNRE